MSGAGIAIRLGPLNITGEKVRRSGMRWLRGNGQLCRAGDLIAFCNIGLDSQHLAEETRDLYLAFATPIAGRLYHQMNTFGGFQDYQPIIFWDETDVIARVEPAPGARGAGTHQRALLFMMAGRRVNELGGERHGLLLGWHDRKRVSHADSTGPIATLLSLASCEFEGVIRGPRGALMEMLGAVEGPAQIVYVLDRPLVPTARIVSEQIRRTDAEREAIAGDLAATLAGGKPVPTSPDWIFAGALLRALQTSPATERYTVMTRNGYQSAGPPDAILLSLNAEMGSVLRHKRLGYTLCIQAFRLSEAGRAFGPWLKTNFESVKLTVDDIFSDYRALIELIRERAPGTQILISNRMSSDGSETIPTYAPFDLPLGEHLVSIREKDIDLMLYDLARECDVAIVDADAIAAELGARRCLHDGVHQNGEMQAELRAEILRILHARRVPGFGPAKIN